MPLGRSPDIYTIGHSTRPLDEFIDALKAFVVHRLMDVRTVPRSRHVPRFNLESLSRSLPAAGIEYLHLPELGGWRKPMPQSPNLAWRNERFRGYADYMLSVEFEAALQKLVSLAGERSSAIMCAEAVPYRCHRSLIADALIARGLRAVHILDALRAEEHRLTPFAFVEGERVTYPSPS